MKVNKQQYVENIVAYQDQKISYYSSSDNTYLMHTYTYYSIRSLRIYIKRKTRQKTRYYQ